MSQEKAPLVGSSEATKGANNPCSGVQPEYIWNLCIESIPRYLRTTGKWIIPVDRCPFCADPNSHVHSEALVSPLTFSAPCGLGAYRVRFVRVQLGTEGLWGWLG